MIVIAPLLTVVAVLVAGHLWQQWEFNQMLKEAQGKKALANRVNIVTMTREERQHAKEWM